ncbi:hypothetical protein QFC22_005814 [Naganishia vaughanmartiniae]|uniref:Uncharacterized protein n=1 Tax=Naganishia vaughanmartiniae TaxID=1424756 RepID=A0ACC2WT56_9TREE|nr:hypothetical protein QFC22_005814 [Naganishia vaughanmartiniae]
MFIARSNVFRAVSKTQQTRFISLSAVRSMPARSQMSDADPKKLGDEKEKHLAGKDQDRQTHPKDAPGWNESLAVSCFAIHWCASLDTRDGRNGNSPSFRDAADGIQKPSSENLQFARAHAVVSLDRRNALSQPRTSADVVPYSLQSESEAVIKAELNADGPPSKELQEKTIEHLAKE